MESYLQRLGVTHVVAPGSVNAVLGEVAAVSSEQVLRQAVEVASIEQVYLGVLSSETSVIQEKHIHAASLQW
jgi:hypothetical protein